MIQYEINDNTLFVEDIKAYKYTQNEHNGTDAFINLVLAHPHIHVFEGLIKRYSFQENLELVNPNIVYGGRHLLSFYIELPKYLQQHNLSFSFHIYQNDFFYDEVTNDIILLGKERFIKFLLINNIIIIFII